MRAVGTTGADGGTIGVTRLTRAVLPLMLAAGRGAIVDVGSEAGSRASASGTAYATSKHAVVGLTKSTAFFCNPRACGRTSSRRAPRGDHLLSDDSANGSGAVLHSVGAAV